MLTRGTQIVFVPHLLPSDHPDVRRGFVTSAQPIGQTVLVHVWQPGHEGTALATLIPIPADGERLQIADSCAQALVDALLDGAPVASRQAPETKADPPDYAAAMRANYARNGNLTVRDMALEVAFSGRSWAAVAADFETITGAKPGVLARLVGRLEDGQTLDDLARAARTDVGVGVGGNAHAGAGVVE